jgi:hypothetical protein
VTTPRRPAAQMLGIRAPAELRDWLETLTRETPLRPSLTLSQAAVWVLTLGREYATLILPFQSRIEAIVRDRGMTRGEVLAEVIKLGLAALEDG